MKTIFALLLATLLSACGGNSSNGPISVTFDGDSIMAGLGIQKAPVAVIKELRPDWIVDDRAVIGLSLEALVRGYEKPFADADPSIFPRGAQPSYPRVTRSTRFVIIEVGGNDIFGELQAIEFESLLRSAILTIASEGRKPILTGIVNFEISDALSTEIKTRRDEFNEITIRLAREYGVDHAGWGEDYRGPVDLIDGLHRTQVASDRLAALLISAIERADE